MNAHKRHALALLALLRLDTRAIDAFDPSPAAARAALGLAWAIIPLRVFASWAGEHILIENLPLYLLVRSLQVSFALFASLPFIWLFCRSQNLHPRFALYVTTYMWLSLFWAVFSALANGLTINILFEVATIKAIGTTLFFVGYAASSYMAALALRCNPFVAIGMATIASVCVAISSDVSNIYLFGSARPLIGE